MIELPILVEKSLALGADQVQIKRGCGASKSVTFESNKLKTIKADQDSGISIKVIVDQKMAVATTNARSLEAIESTIAEVINIARVSPTDEYNCIPEKQEIEPIEGLFDKSIPELGEILALATELVKSTHKIDKRITIDSCQVQWESDLHEIVNSNGIYAMEKSTSTQLMLMGMVCEGETVSSFDYEGLSEIGWLSAKEKAQVVAEKFSHGLLNSLDAKPAPKFKGMALLSPEITGEILGLLSSLVNARNVQEKSSRFADKKGELVMSEIITINDCPRQPAKITSTAYDGEGVATQDFQVIKEGQLQNFIYDSYAAKKDNVISTGHSSGGTSIELHAPQIIGTESLANLKSQIEEGVYVKRFSGEMNSLNGLVSGAIKGGKYIKGGAFQYSITDTTLNTDLFNLFLNIVGVSKECEETFNGKQPYLLVKDVDIIGR